MRKEHIQEAVLSSLQNYFIGLDGQRPAGVYQMIIHAAERPVFVAAMKQARNNQSTAAKILGVNRNTLRKKLQEHELL